MFFLFDIVVGRRPMTNGFSLWNVVARRDELLYLSDILVLQMSSMPAAKPVEPIELSSIMKDKRGRGEFNMVLLASMPTNLPFC